jgi:mRNA interferase MazF
MRMSHRVNTMTMPDPGDVVLVDFAGARGIKRRPSVVVSSRLYGSHRPDLVLGILTTNLVAARTPLDHPLLDWQDAGLQRPSAFRSYLATVERTSVQVIGRLSDRDWNGVRQCVAKVFDLELRH